ncbi:hypothetical protein 015DV002_54 [Bacillus phage 015DV002]|nr:hypothetical protein 000TH008_67 [Bacillus phage 000TH008]QQO40761.1 hypothetical protein 000TH009_67 [Bacillus phage 000TH009]QQO41010.1 hypothetical protein 015DV002_54 [Bacillus phage 015DV002]
MASTSLLTKKELVEEIKSSLPNSRMLDVVNFAGVSIYGKLVVLKDRNKQKRNSSDWIFDLTMYEKQFEEEHNLEELLGKEVVFGYDVLNRRGLLAVLELSKRIRLGKTVIASEDVLYF